MFPTLPLVQSPLCAFKWLATNEGSGESRVVWEKLSITLEENGKAVRKAEHVHSNTKSPLSPTTSPPSRYKETLFNTWHVRPLSFSPRRRQWLYTWEAFWMQLKDWEAVVSPAQRMSLEKQSTIICIQNKLCTVCDTGTKTKQGMFNWMITASQSTSAPICLAKQYLL